MVFVPALGVAKVELRSTLDDQQVENTLFFYLGANPVDSDFETLGDELVTWYSTSVVPNLSTEFVFREAYVTDLTSQSSPTFTRTPVAPVPGQNGSPVLPSNVAFTVSFRTNGRGRSSRGRNYISGLTDVQVAGNELSALIANTFVSAYEELLPGGGALTNGVWGVLSTISNGAPRATGLFQNITTVLYTDLTIDSQRRRLPGRGR